MCFCVRPVPVTSMASAEDKVTIHLFTFGQQEIDFNSTVAENTSNKLGEELPDARRPRWHFRREMVIYECWRYDLIDIRQIPP